MRIKLYVTFLVLIMPVLVFAMEPHYRKAMELYEAGQYRAAQAEFLKAKEKITDANDSRAVAIQFRIADCAGKLGDRNAVELFNQFTDSFPNSIYNNEVQFAIANNYFLDGNYQKAIQQYLVIDRSRLGVDIEEYDFKLAYSYFMTENYSAASERFRMIGGGVYREHAVYYIAYIDYVNGSYGSAKQSFKSLQDSPSYGPIVPYYLLQIEYLEGNYDYVIREGDALLSSSRGERAVEISRIIGESWFHKGDYSKALNYLLFFVENGGLPGRAENYLMGYSYYNLGDYPKAIPYLNRATGPDDKLTQNASYHLADAYLKTGNRMDALRAFSIASSSSYDRTIQEDAMFNYGKLQFETGGGVFNESINTLTRFISDYPDSPRLSQAREYLAAAYYNSKNYDAAYQAIKMIRNPDNNLRNAFQKISYFKALEHYNKGDLDAAYNTLEESLQNKFNPKYTALSQFWKAEIHYRRGDYRKAVPLYREYISLSPVTEDEYKFAEYNLAYCYFNLEQWGEAATWFDRFLRDYRTGDSYRADALNRRADIYYANREFARAEENYSSAQSINTIEKYYSEFQRAMVTGITRGPVAKVDALQKIIDKNDGMYIPDARFELGITYLSMDRYSDAVRTLEAFTRSYPTSDKYTAALSNLGLAYQNLGDNRSALKYYRNVVEIAPGSTESKDAMLALKSIYVDMNDVDSYFDFAARSGVETDLNVVARDSLSYTAAERVYLSSAPRSTAINALGDYLDKYPRGVYRANALYYLAESQLADNRREAAVRSLTQLGDMHYNSFTVRALTKLGPLLTEDMRHYEAAETYRKLAEVAVNPQAVENAYSEYLRNINSTGEQDKILHAVDQVVSSGKASIAVRREARYYEANILYARGEKTAAAEIYRELATESKTIFGAESYYKLAEILYEKGDLDQAEKLVMEFSESNTPHSYWLGRSFLVLGDVYTAKGDSFQARATLQSIVDGYSPKNDGIVDQARGKIEKLK